MTTDHKHVSPMTQGVNLTKGKLSCCDELKDASFSV